MGWALCLLYVAFVLEPTVYVAFVLGPTAYHFHSSRDTTTSTVCYYCLLAAADVFVCMYFYVPVHVE
jgi:hypothetical protein